MKVYRHIKELVTMQGALKKSGRFVKEEDLSIINDAAMIEESGKVVWVGPEKNLKAILKTVCDEHLLSKKNPQTLGSPHLTGHSQLLEEIDLDGRTVLPGFIDSHTHLAFAGQRYEEFELRNNGTSYQEIAARGGGILSTMKATRAISEKNLLDLAQSRVDEFLRQGVTTVEIKSGYALNREDELKQLQIISQLKGADCVSTFLGAHALPPEFKSYEDYLIFLLEQVLPEVKKRALAKRVDIYIENGFFPLVESRQYLQKAKDLGFDLVIHADQLSLSGGTKLAIELGAKSADHVIHISNDEVESLAKSEVTALLLPAADLYMKCSYPPARALIDAGARVALATDFNPGSSPTQDISLVGLLARLYMKMTLPEVISAFTIGGAYALGQETHKGVLQAGYRADFVVSSVEWSGLFYQAGYNPIVGVYKSA
jgi:imidazolonepropionase